jgi:hypothetical protein
MHPVARISHLRILARKRHQCDFAELERHLDQLQAEVEQLLDLAHANDRVPARITISAR